MPRHPSVPDDQTGWVRLGVVTTDAATIAIVGAEMAASLGDEWLGRYLGDDGKPLEIPKDDMGEFEEFEAGDDGDRAVMFTTHSDGGYVVEGRFGDLYGDDHLCLMEVRIRIWGCLCTCHDGEPARENTCDGDCHDEDPAPDGDAGETTEDG
jgi:hypothetical protein